MEPKYFITIGGGNYWSNELGWTVKDKADVFTFDERYKLSLPIGGEWMRVEDANRTN